MWPFGRRSTRFVRNLDHPLLYLAKRDPFSIRDACEGVLATGATGSGKTTGVGQTFASAFLKAGFGGLVLTQKPDEVALWKSYCRRTGRLRDLVIVDQAHGFNFLNYELTRPGSGAGVTHNIVDLLSIGCEIADRSSARGGGGREESFFWKNARNQLCRNIVDVLISAHGEVSVPLLYKFLASAPRTQEQKDSASWQKESFCYQCFGTAEDNCKPEQEADLHLAASYIMNEFIHLGDKTQGNVGITLSSMMDVLNRGIAKQMLCGKTTITPHMMEDGYIIVLGVPLSEFGLAGQLIQGIVKFCFSRALLRRNVKRSPRPVFVWADEAQNFATSFDVSFVATCRSSRVANVYLTQNVPGFRAGMGGGESSKSDADALFGNLNLKAMHANADAETNFWGSHLIGRSRQFLISTSNTHQPSAWLNRFADPNDGRVTAGISEHLDFEVEPRRFTTLRRGGRKRQVDAIVFQGGRVFKATGKTWLPVTFRQKF